MDSEPLRITSRTDPPICPICMGVLRHVTTCGRDFGRSWFEFSVFQCPKDGFAYRSRGGLKGPDDNDRDSLVGAPLKPAPAPNQVAIELAEPD